MVQAIEVDWLEPIMEDFDNLLLRETCKAKGEALDLLGNLTYDIILLP